MSQVDISLFGTCSVRVPGEPGVDVRGAKHRALFALLATAPMGRRSRAYLQEMLWGQADYDSGHQNLRRALSDLRKMMGDDFDRIFHTTMTDIQLDLDRVRFQDGRGVFLHDLNVRERRFLEWVEQMRGCEDELVVLRRAAARPSQRLRPTITALPLTSPDGDPVLTVLGDWVAEELCRTLSRSTLMTVISHLSGRRMASRIVDLEDVRERLGVDYVVTGCLRAHGNEVICDLDFLDTETGRILWNRNVVVPSGRASEALLEEVGHIVRGVGHTVAEWTMKSTRGQPIPQIADHELLITGVSLMHRSRLRDFLAARSYLSEAAKRAPHESDVHAWLGNWHVLNVFKGYTTDRDHDTQNALRCTGQALDLDPESSFALTIDGFIHGNLLGRLDEAGVRYTAALDRNHNESLGWLLRGSLLAFQDKGDAAVQAAETARRLSPLDPFGYYFDSLASTAYLSAGDLPRALELANRSLIVNDRHISTLRAKITAQYGLGDGAGARQTAIELKRKFPTFSLEEYRKTHPSMEGKLGQRVVEALGAAGVN
ncbi:hypothetical protein [Maritimibacter dapengensis]|uniref:TolB amino-terminal domain-containing protein n=1 Tax=Maritimibacter dapengensis TaxID=2836868 RepID=A0ABS6SXC8_9RHOB|nr:hypothetical protein [Maritimibacter dapengensis]MBV7377620.1 hypothetical protein [Maritimibacter dapengensis]